MNDKSKRMEQYFNALQEETNSCYQIAERARKKGLDPELFVESPQARDLAGRVEKLVGPAGIAKVIRELKKQNYTEDQIVFQVVSDILEKKIGNIESLEDRVERAIRAGLAIKTMGVVSAPLEGISKVMIKTDQFGNKYLSLYFSGPIRAAGGTTAALCVLIADYVRKKSNISRYEATEGEIGRFVEEIKLYDRLVHLQYPSSNKEIRFAVKSLPVEISGDPTEKEEVSAFRDLPRIETNNIRGGACLVLNDGILLKAPKLLKIAREMNIEGWDWLGELKKITSEESKQEDLNEDNANTCVIDNEKISPNSKYIKDIIAGRPVFAHPSVMGGHRIRYGRSRNTGLAAGGIHPATMAILDDFIAIGTQLRTERPGKSTSICPVDYIEPPIIKLKNGDVIKITSHEEAKKTFPKIEEVLFLGDILFGFGEFAENNHILIPSGYVEEWWALDLEKALKDRNIEDANFQKFVEDPFNNIPTSEEAISLSKTLDIPLHPVYLDFWGNVTEEEVLLLRRALLEGYSDDMLIIENTPPIKKILEKAFILHRLKDDKIIFSKAMTSIYATIFNLEKKEEIPLNAPKDVFDLFYQLSSIKIRNKAPYFMGTR
ncbi:MAG: DNA-directed DNA polymerase II large subunit, partial [Promethearchaeota archaeon]